MIIGRSKSYAAFEQGFKIHRGKGTNPRLIHHKLTGLTAT